MTVLEPMQGMKAGALKTEEGKRAEDRASTLHSTAPSNTVRAAASPAIKPLAKHAVSR